MLNIEKIRNGIVIDHIKSGLGIRVFNWLGLDKAHYTVAFVVNANSQGMGRKDIIKIENIIDLDYTVIGLIDHNSTISVIENGVITSKKQMTLPHRVENVILCRNPRCVTSAEPALPHVFHLQNAETRTYRCAYCENLVHGIEI